MIYILLVVVIINVTVPGAKNSSLPILSSVLLAKGIYIISNVPNITDIQNLFYLLKQFNVKIDYNNNIAHINTLSLKIPDKINYYKDFRGSYYLIGSIYYLIQTTYNDIVVNRLFAVLRLIQIYFQEMMD